MEVILIAAITADGFIACDSSQNSTDWTSKADRAWFSHKTKEIGVVVMGRATFETIGRPLPGRLNIVCTRRVSELQQKYTYENLEFTDKDPSDMLKDLQSRNFDQVALCGGASLYTQFIKRKLVHKMLLTVEPVIFGQGVNLFKDTVEAKLTLVASSRLGEEGAILLEYTLSYFSK